MTDAEINEAVARKLGWVYVKGPFGNPAMGTIHPDGWKRDNRIVQSIPDYCHDIQAAWEIAEKMFAIKLCKNPKDWLCQLLTEEMAIENKWPVEATADTAPRAICLAFLKVL